jgi:hypothetical protein
LHAWLVMPVLEGQNDTPATDDLDDVMEKRVLCAAKDETSVEFMS